MNIKERGLTVTFRPKDGYDYRPMDHLDGPCQEDDGCKHKYIFRIIFIHDVKFTSLFAATNLYIIVV